MDGDTCRLDEIVTLKNKYAALLMIDEAHSIGILGKQGRGIDSHFNISPGEVDIFTGSLSKAIPANGGFVAGSKDLITYLQHGSSLYIFSAAMGPPSAASVLTTLGILENDEDMLPRLWENTEYLKNGLQGLGYDTGLSTTPIIPIIVGLDQAALNFSKSLFDLGIVALPVIFPAVKSKESRLRLCATAAQDKAYLDEVIEIFRNMSAVYKQ